MKRRPTKHWVGLWGAGLLAALLALAAAPAGARPPVWVAHGAGADVVLFGSVHVLPHQIDWEPDALKSALADADELWFEIPLDPAAILDTARMALAKGMLPQGQDLSDLLSPKGRAALDRTAADLHLPLPELERLRPWLAELTIGQAVYAKDGVSADDGVERRLADAAPQAQRKAFETPQQQIDMFSGAATDVQVQSLEDSLKDLKDDPDQSKRLIEAWRKGDLRALDKEGVEELRRSSPAMFKILLTDRNAAWTRTLLARLDAPPAHPGRRDKVVVVVGVGHLVGGAGVPELLRARGVRVDGPRP
jgi:uncharacterized protein YbaP (TraB family)